MYVSIKHPKTWQEKRKYFDALDNDFVPRKLYGNRNLPHSWKFKYRSDINIRSWKHQRDTQYKGVKYE